MKILSKAVATALLLYVPGAETFVVRSTHTPPGTAATSSTTTLLWFSPKDYAHAVDALSHELQRGRESLKRLEILAARLQEMERRDPDVASDNDVGDRELKRAVADAKAALDRFGSSSLEAKAAFRKVDALSRDRHVKRRQTNAGDGGLVDEIASFPPMAAAAESSASTPTSSSSADDDGRKARYSERAVTSHHDYDAVLDGALLQDTMEAIEKILAFGKFVEVERRRLEEDSAAAVVAGSGPRDEDMPGVPWPKP